LKGGTSHRNGAERFRQYVLRLVEQNCATLSIESGLTVMKKPAEYTNFAWKDEDDIFFYN
jgi:hypothetical protein